MPAGLRRVLWALPFAVGVACWGTWHWGVREPQTTFDAHGLRSTADTGRETHLATGDPALGTSAGESEVEPAEALDTLALRQLCGRPEVAEFTAECLAVLERRYQSSVPDVRPLEAKFRPVMLGEPVTWRQVFENVNAGVAAVREALVRSECLVPKGRFRLDLHDACAADDMARLAILRRECALAQHRYYSLESRQRWLDVELADANRTKDQWNYYKRREQLDERWFSMMWRLDKCRTAPEAALADLGPFRRPLGLRVVEMDQIDMMEAAARLGSDWALSSVLRMGGTVFVVGDEGIDDVREQRPVLAELLRMRRAEGLERVKHALVAFELGEALGIPVHSEGVLRFTGHIDYEQQAAAWPSAARRLIALGWTLMVDDGQGGERRRFETPEDVWGDEPWPEWAASDWLRLMPAESLP